MENPVENKMVTVLGIGGAGCRVLRGFVGSPAAASLRLLAVDTDRRGLEGLNLPEGSMLLAGARWRGGRGCGGNFRYTENGIKDCSGCLFPHRRENYDRVTARFMEIVKKMQEGE